MNHCVQITRYELFTLQIYVTIYSDGYYCIDKKRLRK